MITERLTMDSEETGTAEELTCRIKAGDRAAFADLVRRYQSYAYALAMRFVWEHAEAEDIVQESFIRVWRHFGTLREGMKFTTWLYTIVTRVSMDRIRRRKRWGGLVIRSDGEVQGGELSGGADPERDLQVRDTLERVRVLAGRLPDTQRIVFTLRDLQDLSVEEVGTITGLSGDSIKANLYHARKRLRELMRAQGVNDGR